MPRLTLIAISVCLLGFSTLSSKQGRCPVSGAPQVRQGSQPAAFQTSCGMQGYLTRFL